ncbi:hypothetical protein Tco_1535133 [Tanacetum coccineum]
MASSVAHLNVDKTKIFWSKEDPRSRLASVFLPTIARPLHDVKLLGGPTSVDFDFCNKLAIKKVAKSIMFMDAVAKINDSQCELLLLRSCTGDVLNYAFLASRPQFAGLQTKLLLHTRIVASGPIFDDALCVFNTSTETDLLSYLSDIAAPKLMKKMADIFHMACSRVFAGDIYGDHVVSCVGIIGIKHHHNVVRDTLVYICYRSGISAGLNVCVDATQRKHVKYMAKCAAIGYGFLPFSFSSLGELEEDTITLQKLIQKFSMVQDIGAHAVVHIFNMINFTIAKGVGAHIVSQLPSNLL